MLFTGLRPGDADFVSRFAAGAAVAAEAWNPLAELRPLHRGAARQLDALGERGSLLAPALGMALRGLTP